MAQQTLERPDADGRSRIDRDYDRRFNAAVEGNARPDAHGQDTQGTNNTANNLNNQENSSAAPDYDKSIADREKDNSGTWKNNVSEKEEGGNKRYGGKKKVAVWTKRVRKTIWTNRYYRNVAYWRY